MVTHKTRLLILLVAEAALIALHVLLRESTDLNVSNTFEWHFWLAILGGVVLFSYAQSIQCPETSCREMQVFRGISIFKIRLPGERCYLCKASMAETSIKTEIRTTVVSIVIILLIIYATAYGMTRTMFGVVMGVALFSYTTFGREFWPERIPLVIGCWALLISACLYAIGFMIGGFSWHKFVEMVTCCGDPPYLLSYASTLGTFGVLVIVTTPLRMLWK